MERKELYAKIAQQVQYISENVSYTEDDDVPDFNFDTEEMKLTGLHERVRVLTIALNNTNNLSFLDEGKGMSLMEAIALRDTLKLLVNSMQSVRNTLRYSRGRTTQDELKTFMTYTKDDVDPLLEEYQRELKEIDAKIQMVNWTYDLIE